MDDRITALSLFHAVPCRNIPLRGEPGRELGVSPRAGTMNLWNLVLPNPDLVYVVDDDASILKSVARLLRQLGYASLLFPSAEAFANHDDFERAACILLDINLGHVSGIDLGHRLKAANVSVPIIYMTGNDNPAVRKAALQSGGLAYLTKPFSTASLAEVLRRASAGRWRQRSWATNPVSRSPIIVSLIARNRRAVGPYRSSGAPGITRFFFGGSKNALSHRWLSGSAR